MGGTLWTWMAEHGVSERMLERHAAALAQCYERFRRRQQPEYRLGRLTARVRQDWLDAARWMLEAGAQPHEWVEVQMERGVYPNVLRGPKAVEYFKRREEEYRQLAKQLVRQQATLYLRRRASGLSPEEALRGLDPEFLRFLQGGKPKTQSLFHRLFWEELCSSTAMRTSS